MKIVKFPFILLAAMIVLLSSCLDETPSATIDRYEIRVEMPEGFRPDITYSNKSIILKSNRFSYTGQTNGEGVVVFTNIVPDIYSISTSWEIEGEDYIEMADTVVESRDVVLSGSIAAENIFAEGTKTLSLTKSVRQSLIVSKVYASGTKDNNNRNYVSDQYIEFFNNSDDEVVIDSTYYFGLVEAESVIAYPASNNPGFVYARQIFRFFDDATQLAVQPGGTVLVVNSAVNHQEFAPVSVNLRTADFEAKSPTFSNNSAVRELKLIFSAFPSLIYMNLVRGGDNGIFLFKTDENVKQFPVFYIPGRETGNRYMRIPANLIFDGVELLKNKVNVGPDATTKRLQSFIDAGFMNINALSGYTNESTERRVDKTKSNGTRYYLIDTNNSTNDMRTVTDPTPGKYDKALLN